MMNEIRAFVARQRELCNPEFAPCQLKVLQLSVTPVI